MYSTKLLRQAFPVVRRAAAFGLAGLLALPVLSGQVAPQIKDPSTKATARDDPILLSPFTVTDAGDSGYLATETLAGTRIKTDLRDVGTTVSIINKQFLEDTGIKNASELLIHTAGTETGGPGGNFSAVNFSTRFGEAEPGDMMRSPQFATRVRGISAPDLTRDYFSTRIPFDSYNTERVEINRGANAILFGLGSPTGIINNATIRPTFRNFGSVNVRGGEHGSFRSSLDINREVVDGKLAARVALLHDREEYHQRPAFEEQNRYFGAITWKPFRSTTVRVNAERGNIDGNRPNPVSYSEGISSWILSGNPVHDNTPFMLTSPKGLASLAGFLNKPYAQGGVRHPGMPARTLDLGGGAVFNTANAQRQGITTELGFWQFQSAVRFDNYNVPRPTGSLDNLATTDLPNPALASGPHPLDLDPTSRNGTPQLRFLVQEPLSFMYGPGYSTQGLNDRRAFDWVNNLLFGDSAFQNSDFTTVTAALEQTFLDNKAGIEISFDRQKWKDFAMNPQTELRGAIHIDNNVMLPVTPNGINQPNPNYLRPYTFVSTNTNEGHEQRDAVYATGFYQFDFREKMASRWASWLGKHVLTGIASRQTIDREEINRSPRWTDALLLRQSGTDNALGVQALAQSFVYLGPPVSPTATSMSDIKIHRLDGVKLYDPNYANPITHWEPGVQPGTANGRANGTTLAGAQQILALGGPTGKGNLVTRNVPYDMLVGGVTFRKDTIKSQAINLQSFWLTNNLVSTVGWRKDDVTVHQLGAGNLKQDLYGATIISGVKATDDPSPDKVSDETLTWSLVGHWPERFFKLPYGTNLSVHYSRSSNFQPAVGRINEMGAALENPRGDTKEYGFTVSTRNNKFMVRVNWYETSLLNASAPIVNYGSMPTLWLRWFGEGARAAEDQFRVTGAPQHDAARRLNDATAEYIWSATPARFKELWNVQVLRNAQGNITGYTSAQPSGISDTENIAAKGTEIELAYNPTRNWRMKANFTRQQAFKSNVNPVSREWRNWVRSTIIDAKVPGYNLAIGDLPAGITLREYFPERTGRAAFGTEWAASPANQTAYESTKLNFDTPLDTILSGENALSKELREWRVNLATTYDFREGRLKGFSLGGAWRYQSKVAIGYQFKDIDGNGTLDAADVTKPYYGPAEHDFDVWTDYRLPYFERYGKWSVGLNVRNVLGSPDDLIPIQAHTDGNVARFRYAPQRVIYLSSKFNF